MTKMHEYREWQIRIESQTDELGRHHAVARVFEPGSGPRSSTGVSIGTAQMGATREEAEAKAVSKAQDWIDRMSPRK